jgi:hypothetical protein
MVNVPEIRTATPIRSCYHHTIISLQAIGLHFFTAQFSVEVRQLSACILNTVVGTYSIAPMGSGSFAQSCHDNSGKVQQNRGQQLPFYSLTTGFIIIFPR